MEDLLQQAFVSVSELLLCLSKIGLFWVIVLMIPQGTEHGIQYTVANVAPKDRCKAAVVIPVYFFSACNLTRQQLRYLFSWFLAQSLTFQRVFFFDHND